MSDRYPLIANSETNRIEELASGDNLNLDNTLAQVYVPDWFCGR